jgi:hypothetical protein
MSVLDLGGDGHEIVVKPCRAFSCRYLVNCIAVRPERHGNVANRNRLRHRASQDHGRSAEAGGQATEAGAGGASPDIVNRSNANRSNVIGFARGNRSGARFTIREACQAGEAQQQLQRWLRNKLQNRERPLGWM